MAECEISEINETKKPRKSSKEEATTTAEECAELIREAIKDIGLPLTMFHLDSGIEW